MLATKGRASYLGERSIGHMDPGACCISIIFEGLVKASTNAVDLGVNITTSTSPQSAKPVEERKYQMLPITRNVSVLVISHSLPLAKATFDFASEMKTGDFAFEYIGGIENGKLFGTNPQEIKERIQKLATDSEVLIIYDLGSSKMNSEMAISLIPEYNSRVQIASCAFVEGVTIAVSSNNTTSASELRKIVETDVHVNK
jgi:dihydroxyacetone kinase DhaKLM complex PTS-EIIA-like component DhaM